MSDLTPPETTAMIPPISGIAEIRTDVFTNTRSLFAKQAFAAGDVVSDFYWSEILAEPSYLTVQIGENQHVELLPKFLECVNHSCDPNVFFDTNNTRLIAIKPIANGEELVFFYPSAEWDMDQPFNCHCGTAQCIGYIAGAKYLTPAQKAKYRFTDFIRQKLA